MSKKEEGRITISRVYCNKQNDFITIEIDDKEHCRVADAQVSLENFAKTITGMGSIKCTMRTYSTPDAGLIDALEKAYGMISVEKGYCPQCGDGSGAYYDNDSNVCQCQWCYEAEQIKQALATYRSNS
jgi:hypothetical protein